MLNYSRKELLASLRHYGPEPTHLVLPYISFIARQPLWMVCKSPLPDRILGSPDCIWLCLCTGLCPICHSQEQGILSCTQTMQPGKGRSGILPHPGIDLRLAAGLPARLLAGIGKVCACVYIVFSPSRTLVRFVCRGHWRIKRAWQSDWYTDLLARLVRQYLHVGWGIYFKKLRL